MNDSLAVSKIFFILSNLVFHHWWQVKVQREHLKLLRQQVNNINFLKGKLKSHCMKQELDKNSEP